ncbi:hypothetical protein HYALB_00009799 [Hymenoscyphus albidus]|uniref:Uncharacterized protein n=1 Tax=Hymenoscyphus albidus TaxID=595503 RepID=A0A9N9LKK2_9HELO|nr:hypothetical protein HYALB_00009799 [Hymenoscyphus albidus]
MGMGMDGREHEFEHERGQEHDHAPENEDEHADEHQHEHDHEDMDISGDIGEDMDLDPENFMNEPQERVEVEVEAEVESESESEIGLGLGLGAQAEMEMDMEMTNSITMMDSRDAGGMVGGYEDGVLGEGEAMSQGENEVSEVNIKAESPSPIRQISEDEAMSQGQSEGEDHQQIIFSPGRKKGGRGTGTAETGGGSNQAVLGMLESYQAQLRMLREQGGFDVTGMRDPVPMGVVSGVGDDDGGSEREGGGMVVGGGYALGNGNVAKEVEVEVEDPTDTTWMHEEPEEDQELQELIQLRNLYERKVKQGKITNGEKMELYRAQKRIKFLVRMAEAREEGGGEEEESLFVEEEGSASVRERIIVEHERARPESTLVEGRGFSEDEGMGMDDGMGMGMGNSDGDTDIGGEMEQAVFDLMGAGNETMSLEPTPLPTSKTHKKRPRNAREAFVQAEEDRGKARAKAQRKKSRKETSTTTSKSKSKSKGKSKSKSSKSSKKDQYPSSRQMVNGESGHDNISEQIIRGLAATDDIATRIHDPIFKNSMGPTITGKLRKKDQFAELFANIPSGGEQRKIRNDKNSIKNAAKSFGYAQVRAQDGRWKVKGMKSLLYHYQLVGAQWMLTRELAGINPHGGLLADSMGLGKTVQTLACMVGNRPGDLDKKRRIVTTLIVLPAAVIRQWAAEIKKHTEPGVFDKVIIYKGDANYSREVLASVDIVLASYTEVWKQFPFPNDASQKAAASANGFKAWAADKEFGPLHQIDWYRVVLDEAHAIKNNSSRTSLACQHLKSVYRWCLTGTPLLNNVEELFPYLRFLKADYCMDIREFKKYFCDPQDPRCSSRVATLLEFSMLRRTMKSTMLNCPIIKLPEPHPHIEKISFSDEERIIYRITENRFRSILNSYIMRGDAKRNYTMWMVQLLRLRQCTGHPFMMERTIKETWDLSDVQELKNQLESLGSRASLPFYERTKLWVEESAAKKQAGGGAGEGFGKGSFGSTFSLGKALGTLDQRELLGRLQCGVCGDIPVGAVQVDACHEIFCRDCLLIHEEETRAEDDVKTCPSCALIYTTATPLRGLDDEDYTFESEPTPLPTSQLTPRQAYNSTRRRGKNRVPENSKGRDAFGFEMYTPYSSWLTQSDEDPNFPLTSSAKVTALKRILLRGFEEAPMDKVVIYCQFRQLQRIIGRMCNQEKWKFVYYTGDISMEHRALAEEQFKTNPEIVIMIAGLKCGGLGLNLTSANRVISMDLWWNFGVEQQAFGRIFRIGQEKETHMTRIVVKNSVDMRMLSRQDQKLKDLRAVVDDDLSVVKRKELSMQELSSLFGFLRTDEDGELLGVDPDYLEGEAEGEGEGGDDEVVTKVEAGLDEENLYYA